MNMRVDHRDEWHLVKADRSNYFSIAPTADFKPIGAGNCTVENISVWLKIQDSICIFFLNWLAVVTEKGKKKSPSLQFICNKTPLYAVFFIQNVVWVFVWTFLWLLSRPSNRWMYQKVWESHWKQIAYHFPTNLLAAWLLSQAVETTSGMRGVSVNQHDSYLPNPPVTGKPGVIST